MHQTKAQPSLHVISCIYLLPLHIWPLAQCSWSAYEILTMLQLQTATSSPCFSGGCLPAVNEHPAASSRLCSSTSFVRSALSFLSVFFYLLSHSLTLPRCIHYCAFKKSPRITNLEESELSRVTEEGWEGLHQTRTHRSSFYSGMRV